MINNTTISSLFHLQSGFVFQRAKAKLNHQGELYKTLSLKAFQKNLVFTPSKESVDTQRFTKVDTKYITEIDDILVRLRIPTTALIVEEGGEGVLIPSHVAILRLRQEMKEVVCPKFFVTFFNSPEVQARLANQARGSSMISMIHLKILSQYPVPNFPFIAEQKRIVQLMELLEEEHALLEKQLELFQLKKRSIEQAIFTNQKA